MFTGKLWDPGKAAIKAMAHEAQSQAPGSEASTSSGLRPSKANLQRPMSSEAKHSQSIRTSMCSTSIIIGPGDRDMSAALNIRRNAAGPGHPRELSSGLGRPAMPNPGTVGQEWMQVRDRGLLRKWQLRHQRQR